MKLEDAASYTEKCFSGEPAPCSGVCPLRLDIRSFLEKVEKGRWNPAYKTLRNAVVFPAIVCSLCSSPCEGRCEWVKVDGEPIAVRLVEDACVRSAKNQKPDIFAIPPKTESIAVVGAGVAGLSAALCLSQKKYKVTVFDKNIGWGGSLRSHPRFEIFDRDIELQFSAAGTLFEFGTEITSPDTLDRFDMIYLAPGAGGIGFDLLSSWNAELLTTSEPKIFLGGSLTGADKVLGIAQGKSISITAEFFFQTGKAAASISGISISGCGKESCELSMPDVNVKDKTRIVPSGLLGYSEDEAKAEAERCLKCDCDRCVATCEMLASFKKKPKKIAIEVYTDTQVNPPLSAHTLTRQAYSCNMCGHCKTVCPVDVDIGSLLQLSRRARTGDSAYPEAFHDYWLREMDFSTGEASFYASPKNGGDCRYIFYPGCQLGAHNPEHVTGSFMLIQKEHTAGIYQGCCGAPAFWAGDSKRQDENFAEIRKVWLELNKAVFVFACATCESIFSIFLPEIPRISLYELIAASSELSPARIFESASVFDPCNARGNTGMEKAVRDLARKSGSVLHDLPEKNRCCGYGGHMRTANPELYETIAGNRAGMGSYPYIVYCANCREVFLSRGKECAHVLDFALNLASGGSIHGIDERRENAIKVKIQLMKDIAGNVFIPEKHEWDDLKLVISDGLKDSAEKKLISQSNIKEAVWYAEKTGDKFIDRSGLNRCSLQKPVVTYWVSYRKASEKTYEILEVYSHRMRFGSEES